MDPVTGTIAVAAIATQVGGALFGNKAQKKAARQQMEILKKQAEAARDERLYRSRIASMNKDIVLGNIRELNKAERSNLNQVRVKLDKVQASQQITFAASGFSQASGTLSALQEEALRENSLEINAIRDSFSRGRWDIRLKAQQFGMEADRLFNEAVSLDPMNNNYGLGSGMANASLITDLGNIGMGGVNYFG
jgi:hypothetical protein